MRQTVAVRLPAELTARLDLVADEEGTSRSEVVREAVRRYLALRELQKVRESVIRYAKATGVLSDEDVFRSMS